MLKFSILKTMVLAGATSFSPKTSSTSGKSFRLLKPIWLITLLFTCISFSQAQFTIYESWDFESETLGTYTDQEINEDFDVAKLISHSTTDIVMDTINGNATKVLSVRHDGNQLNYGLDLQVKLDDDYDELYMSYRFKFSDEFNSTAGGKIPGFIGFPIIEADTCAFDNDGFVIKNLFKQAGSMVTYHYDRTPGTGYPNQCPWATEEYYYDTIYFNNGCWYDITKRLKMNSFTNGEPNTDGIHEVWVDGRMIFKETGLIVMSMESDTMKIDGIHIAHWYGGGSLDYTPITTCYGYMDDIKVWVPTSDTTFGTFSAHDEDHVLPTPDVITDRTVYYDSLITSEGTLSNSQYGSNYSGCIDEAYLIDAGEGNTVTFNVSNGIIDSGDFLFFYDGNTTDARLIDYVQGYNSVTGTRESTGRYMFVRFSTNRDDSDIGWIGTISFDGDTLTPSSPTNLHATDSTSSSISIAWTDNSSNESKFIIERSLSSGSGFTVIDSVNANVNSYTNTGLSSNTTYYYKVKARNSNGDSGYSNTANGTTQNTSSVTNVALNKTVSQSSTDYDGYANLAVDGDTNGSYSNGSVTHTDSEANAWWQVDLGQDYSISSIEVWNRTDACCMDRLDNYYVMLADTFTSTSLSTALSESTWSEHRTSYPDSTHYFSPSASGRYVRVQLGDTNNLSLAEVVVWGSDTVVNTAPDAPSSLNVTDSTTTTISLSWTDNSDDEDKFIIERSLSSGSGFAVIDSVNANVTSYTNTGLSSSTTYYYKVKARNSYGDSGYSNEESATTLGSAPVRNVAINKTATQISTSEDAYASLAVDNNTDGNWLNGSVATTQYENDAWWQVDLDSTFNIQSIEIWNRTDCCTDRLDSIYVFVSEDAFTSTDIATTIAQSGVNSYYLVNRPNPDTSLTVGESGRYVRIQSTKSNSYINLAEVKVWGSFGGGSSPAAPSGLETTDSTATSITIGWTDNASDEDKFIIERSFLSGSGFAVIDSVSANVTSYNDTGLITDTTYYYKVKAKNSYGESSYSNTLEAHTADVSSTNISQGKTATQSSTYYIGYASLAVDGNTNGVFSNESVTHTEDETNAWWQVDLGDDYQVTSIEVWNRTDACCMDRLDNYYVMLADTLTSTSLSTALTESTWSEHKTTYPDSTHYFYPDTTGHYVRVQLGDTNNLSLAEVIVWGYDADLKKAILSEEIKSGIEPEKSISVYPNPGSTMITISGFEQAVEIKMVDMLGKVVYLEGKVNNSTQIDVNNLKKGLYLILVKKENNVHVTKFIKN